jgi:hypothetical protein
VKSEKEESSDTSSALASIAQTLKDVRDDSRLAMENKRMRLKLKRLKSRIRAKSMGLEVSDESSSKWAVLLH